MVRIHQGALVTARIWDFRGPFFIAYGICTHYMAGKAKQNSWVLRLRGACPKGWFVRNMRGKVYLRVTSGTTGADTTCVTLPIAWAADTITETVQLILELHELVGDGCDSAMFWAGAINPDRQKPLGHQVPSRPHHARQSL